MNYLGQDRSQIQFAIKELSRGMAHPTEEDKGRLKKLVRFLKGSPRYINHYCYQEAVDRIVVWTDTDFAGCRKGRKSTSGGMMMLGTHVIKSWSTNQAVIALSSGEAEYYGMVKGASQAMGLKAMAEDIGVRYAGPIQITVDASAAIGIASRRGLGKIRHLEVSQLWLQQKVANGDLKLVKVNGVDNLADALTKHLGAGELQKHMLGVGLEERGGRHEIMPQVAQDGEEEYLIQMTPGEDEEGVALEVVFGIISVATRAVLF